MKEQIEEIRKEVSAIHRFFMEDDDYEDLDDYIADELYNAGYRKQKEGEWIIKGLANPKCSACNSYNRCGDKSDFCPNCGAHMRGGKNE